MQSEDIQNVVITGANQGIGYETMRALYLTGNFNILFGSRNMDKNQQAKQKLIKEFGEKHHNQKPPLLQYFKLDLASRESIQKFVQNVNKIFHQVHILINNAGALFNLKQVVKELSFQVQKTLLVNYFSVFYLIYLFFQHKLIRKDTKNPTRIINVSSSAHSYCQNKMFQDLDCKQRWYSSYRQYSIAKFFLTAFTKQLGRKLEQFYQDQKQPLMIKTVSLHPGVINTNIGSDVMLAKAIKFVVSFWMKTNAQGAKSSIQLSQISFEELRNGAYYDQNGKETKADKRTNDLQLRERLWKLSEEAFGIKFQI